MAPLGALSELGAELEAEAPLADRHTAGLVEQHAELISRLEEGAPNAEFVTFPGFWSDPSQYQSRFSGSLTKIRGSPALVDDTDTDLPTPGSKNVTLCATLGRPFARGTIHIASTDPLAQPKIDPHVFEEEWGTSLTLTAAPPCISPQLIPRVHPPSTQISAR